MSSAVVTDFRREMIQRIRTRSTPLRRTATCDGSICGRDNRRAFDLRWRAHKRARTKAEACRAERIHRGPWVPRAAEVRREVRVFKAPGVFRVLLEPRMRAARV